MTQPRDDRGSPGTGEAWRADPRDATVWWLEHDAHYRTLCDIAEATAMERNVFAREGRRAVRESREAIGEADRIMAERPRTRPAKPGTVLLADDPGHRRFVGAASGVGCDEAGRDAAAKP